MKKIHLSFLAALIPLPMAVSAESVMRQDYPRNWLTKAEVEKICLMVKGKRNESSIDALIYTMSNRRNISPSALVNNILSRENCVEHGHEGATVVTQAMYSNHYNLTPFFENMLDFERPIRDLDGTFKKPQDLAQSHLDNATTEEDKARWGKALEAILSFKEGS